MLMLHGRKQATAVFLAGTMLAGMPSVAAAQVAPATTPAQPQNAPQQAQAVANLEPIRTIRSITVEGSQRIEPDTVLSYIKLRTGQPYTNESLDEAVRDLFATELFADAQIRNADGALTIVVKENPIVNRIAFEGNKRIKEDKLGKELKLAPRQIFTRSKVRADVARIVELYRRQGRYAALVEPKMVMLEQNRVDVIYEITEGAKSRVRRIDIIGNNVFSDKRLRGEMATKETGLTKIFSSGTSYDPDRMAYDQSKLRQFYLTQGYADFRVVSSVAELTPDRRDFIITYVVEEGDRYKFGDVTAESDIRDFKAPQVQRLLPMKKGDWYNAKLVEDTVESVTKAAGLFGYAFAQVDPQFQRDAETKTMNIVFRVNDAPRVYVERIDVNGNTLTQDKVVRREFRLAEGDPFNTFSIKRSEDRIKSLDFFQEKFEIQQSQGSAPDRVVLQANVEEKATGSLELSAGFSSLERFLLNAQIRQRNFRGKGQELRAGVSYSTYSKSVELGFTEPYLFDRNVALGVDLYRRDYNSFNFARNGDRNTTYKQVTTGGQARVGVPLTEFWTFAGRYTLNFDDVTLDRNTYYFNGQCDPLIAGRYLCDAIGKRTTSMLGYSLVFDNLNNGFRPTSGQRVILSQDFAGLGGNVKYLRTRADASKYWNVGGGFVFSAHAEGGYIHPLKRDPNTLGDDIRLTDRFLLGEPQIRGFDIRGVGPRVLRYNYDLASFDGTTGLLTKLVTDKNQVIDDAIGGRAYYMGRLELEIPLGSGARELGLRPSVYVDAGAVWNVRRPLLSDSQFGVLRCQTAAGVVSQGPLFVNGTNSTTGKPERQQQVCATGSNAILALSPFTERFFGNSPSPRVSVGVGVNWRSPFGPLRLDLAKALLTQEGDQTKLFSFNVGTQF